MFMLCLLLFVFGYKLCADVVVCLIWFNEVYKGCFGVDLCFIDFYCLFVL